jgi:hypothetical protein
MDTTQEALGNLAKVIIMQTEAILRINNHLKRLTEALGHSLLDVPEDNANK